MASVSGGSTASDATSTTGIPATTSTDTTTQSSTSTTTLQSSGPTETSSSTSGADTTTGGGEPFMLVDPLVDGTLGTALGGSFGSNGWTVTGVADRVYWEVPTLAQGSVEFTVEGMTLDNMPLEDHEIFSMYEGGWGIEHPIGYNPEYRVNDYKSMIRVYGQAEIERVGQQKIMWKMCPGGAPGFREDPCPCTEFFEEPFGGDGTWDGSAQRLRVEWADGMTRYLRNDAVVLEIDWSGSGLSFGPQALYVSIGTSRPEEVDTASMPLGAVFRDVVIEGITGPLATCE